MIILIYVWLKQSSDWRKKVVDLGGGKVSMEDFLSSQSNDTDLNKTKSVNTSAEDDLLLEVFI